MRLPQHLQHIPVLHIGCRPRRCRDWPELPAPALHIAVDAAVTDSAVDKVQLQKNHCVRFNDVLRLNYRLPLSRAKVFRQKAVLSVQTHWKTPSSAALSCSA